MLVKKLSGAFYRRMAVKTPVNIPYAGAAGTYRIEYLTPQGKAGSNNKAPGPADRGLPYEIVLFLRGGTHGADIGASAAIDALVGIDFILAVAFGNRLHGAFGFASAAADAFIGNLICHGGFTSLYTVNGQMDTVHEPCLS